MAFVSVTINSLPCRFNQGSSSSPVLLENLQCTTTGYECYHDGFGNTDCTHDKDIAVSCKAGTVAIITQTSHNLYSCVTAASSVILVNKSHPNSYVGGISGHLKIYRPYYSGNYRGNFLARMAVEVCDFDQTAANVVCRQLGYERAYKYGDAKVLDLG